MDLTMLWHAAAGLLLGAVLGLGFFGGLWYTLQHLPRARHPAALALASLTVRLALAVLGFYLVLRMAAIAGVMGAVVGFLIARIALTRSLASAGVSGPRVP
jgi:F1F0 ATPase subunit 2